VELKQIKDVLLQNGLTPPALSILKPDANPYSVGAFQPDGNVEIGDGFIRGRDLELFQSQFIEFLKLGVESGSDLLIAPEYSCPWSVIERIAEGEVAIGEDSLLILGCESVSLEHLTEIRDKTAERVFWFWEPSIGEKPGVFLDPACWVFIALYGTGAAARRQLVIFVQFKTNPMGGDDFERDRLILGQNVYALRGDTPSICITTLICSDVFNPELSNEDLRDMGHDGILVHIQLNENPYSSDYAEYRKRLFKTKQNVEVICLNWEAGLHFSGFVNEKCDNPSSSCHYIHHDPPTQLDLTDHREKWNHDRGMYLTYWRAHHSYAYFLNFRSGVFAWKATKPSDEISAGAMSGRTGPEMIQYYDWASDVKRWVPKSLSDADGYHKLLGQVAGDLTVLHNLGDRPMDAERFVALSAGYASRKDWDEIERLEFLRLDGDEVIRRIRYTHDRRGDPDRMTALARISRLTHILDSEVFPLCIKDLDGVSFLDYESQARDQNLFSAYEHVSGTVIYLGEVANEDIVEEHYRDVSERLGKGGNDELRLVVWHQDTHGQLGAKWNDVSPVIDDPGGEHGSVIDRS